MERVAVSERTSRQASVLTLLSWLPKNLRLQREVNEVLVTLAKEKNEGKKQLKLHVRLHLWFQGYLLRVGHVLLSLVIWQYFFYIKVMLFLCAQTRPNNRESNCSSRWQPALPRYQGQAPRHGRLPSCPAGSHISPQLPYPPSSSFASKRVRYQTGPQTTG